MFTHFVQGIKNSFRQQTGVFDEVRVWRQFQHWYESALGQRLAEQEQQILDQYLPDLFGYYLLQCGNPLHALPELSASWLQASRVPSRFVMDYDNNHAVNCIAYHDQLPIKSDSLDVVVLPHVLEFAADPHLLLRETERVLIAEGHVVILGFNAWGIWNLLRKLPYFKTALPANAHFLPASRVADWLQLLGFDVVQRKGYFFRPPLQGSRLYEKTAFLEKLGRRLWPNFGACYVLVARKRVETLTPIRPRWRRRPRVMAGGLEPLNRTKHD